MLLWANCYLDFWENDSCRRRSVKWVKAKRRVDLSLRMQPREDVLFIVCFFVVWDGGSCRPSEPQPVLIISNSQGWRACLSLSGLCGAGFSSKALFTLSKDCTHQERFPDPVLLFYYGGGMSYSKGRREKGVCFLQQDAKSDLYWEKK